MTLSAGTVILDDESKPTPESGGLALALFNAHIAAATAAGNLPDPDHPTAAVQATIDAGVFDLDPDLPHDPNPPKVKENAIKARKLLAADMALQANAYGDAIITYLKANAVITVSGLYAHVYPDTILGRLPAAFAANAPIQGPAAEEFVEVGFAPNSGAVLT